MSAVPAASYLADFDPGAAARPPPRPGGGASQAEDPAAKLKDEFARGLAQGRAEAQAESEAKLEAQRSEFVEELAAARQEWATSTGEELARRLDGALGELQSRVAETTARILKPFVAEALRQRALAELKTTLDSLLAADTGAALAVSGPADVLEVLRQHISDRIVNITYTPGEACDVRIVAGQATLETQLTAWLTKLDEAVP